MSSEHIQRARDIVHKILYITIASVSSDGKPWNSPVYSSFDNDGNFYWISSPDAQHSRNIEANSNVAIVIYDSTVPEGTGKGVYVEAHATAISDPQDIACARRHLSQRVDNDAMGEHLERLLEDGFIHAYRATPIRVWMNDVVTDKDGNYVHDIRVDLPLESLHSIATW